MDMQLNAMDNDDVEMRSGEESPSSALYLTSPTVPPVQPPAFTIPTSTSGNALSALLSPDDTQKPQSAPPPPRAINRTGLSSLMSSPMADDSEDGEEHHTTKREEPAPEQVSIRIPVIDETQLPREEGEKTEVAGQESSPSSSVLQPYTPSSVASDSPLRTSSLSSRSHPGIEINLQSVVYSDQELEQLKKDLQLAVQKYLIAEAKSEAGAPPTKRQKKGKQHRKARAQAVSSGESVQEIQRCINHLNRKVSVQCSSSTVLSDVVRFCLAFYTVLNEQDPIEKALVYSNETSKVGDEVKQSEQNNSVTPVKLQFESTIARVLSQKPIYYHLTCVIRRAILCYNDAAVEELLVILLNWCMSSSSPPSWMWLFAFVAEMNSFVVHEFLFRQAVLRGLSESGDVSWNYILPVLEYVATKYPAQMVDILRDLLEECASEDMVALQGKSARQILGQVLVLAGRSAPIVAACDDSLQWIITQELVYSFARQCTETSGESNGQDTRDENIITHLLQFIERRCAELLSSGVQLVLLLQQLSIPVDSTPLSATVARSASLFHDQILQFASSDEAHTFLERLYRYLPYISQTALRVLRSLDQEEESNTHQFDRWKQWLLLLAKFISRKEVVDQLLEADLLLSENIDLLHTSAVSSNAQELQFCNLLGCILVPFSSEYVEFMKRTIHTCHSSTSRVRQRRILTILGTLVSDDGNLTRPFIDSKNHLPVELSSSSDTGLVSAFHRLVSVNPWKEKWKEFDVWRGSCGADFWEGWLDLSCSKDPEVAFQSLSLVSRTAFPSLEDPVWQYRCMRKFIVVFFNLLKQYRTELVHRKTKGMATANMPIRLETHKTNLFRLLALEGGVAHYSTSVYSVFVSLWIDFLLSTTSATSIPTHFPNRINTIEHATQNDGIIDQDDRVVIRSERTISSKCTNLQSSKVITQVSETLVFRKALDDSWEREMDAARICSVYATELLMQLLSSTLTSSSAAVPSGMFDIDIEKQCERKLKAVVDLLLERAIPCCGILSDEVYKETLPNRSSFDVDLRIEQWLNHYPAFLPLLRIVIVTSASINSTQSRRLVPVIKSALIVLMGHWNSVKGELDVENMDVPPYMRNRNQLTLTCELMRLLRLTGWIPSALGKAVELLPLTTPADIRAILLSCWFYLSDHPPAGSRAPTPATSAPTSPISSTSSPAISSGNNASMRALGDDSLNDPLEFYLIPLRRALHRNIRKVGAKYPMFQC